MSRLKVVRMLLAAVIGGCIAGALDEPFPFVVIGAIALVAYVIAWTPREDKP